MNVALILAGGVDANFVMDVPKQFVNVNNRPIIVYTLQKFQRHSEIDAIAVACLDGWQEMVSAYAKQFGISKLKCIIKGGWCGQESSRNGTMALKEFCKEDDIIVVHDAIRPLVSDSLISDSIATCKSSGMGVSAICSMDTIMKSSDGRKGIESISRYEVMRIQTPQAYRYDMLCRIHEEAKRQGIDGEVDTNSVASRLGETIYFSKGSESNIKINTVEDVETFKVLYQMTELKANQNARLSD